MNAFAGGTGIELRALATLLLAFRRTGMEDVAEVVQADPRYEARCVAALAFDNVRAQSRKRNSPEQSAQPMA